MYDLTLRPPRHRVDRRALTWWITQSSIFALPLPITFATLWVFIPLGRTWFGLGLLVTLVPGLLYMTVMPVWRYRVHRWEYTNEAVYAASGWLWQRWRVVPLSRVQTVDTLRGPIQQMYGLSGIRVTTASASGAVKIKGLDHKVAADVVHELTAFTQDTRGDAT